MNRKDCTIEDILEMSDRERNRLVAEWLGERLIIINEQDRELIEQVWVVRSGLKIKEDERAPQYHKKWKHCGRVLDALSKDYKMMPIQWVVENMTYDPDGSVDFMSDTEPLSKLHITMAAAICWLKGIEPMGKDE